MITPIVIANPVYDCVFKFLLEDNEIAKELICLITQQSMENEEIFEKSLRQHLQDHIIKEEQALEQLADARTREAAAVAEKQAAIAREQAAMADKQAAMAEKQAAMAEKQAAVAEKQAAVTEAAAMQIKVVQLLASLGKSAEEIALDLEISLAACNRILAGGV